MHKYEYNQDYDGKLKCNIDQIGRVRGCVAIVYIWINQEATNASVNSDSDSDSDSDFDSDSTSSSSSLSSSFSFAFQSYIDHLKKKLPEQSKRLKLLKRIHFTITKIDQGQQLFSRFLLRRGLGLQLENKNIGKLLINSENPFALLKLENKKFNFDLNLKCGDANIKALKPSWI